MKPKDAQILASIAKSSLVSIDSSIAALTHLLQNLRIYKECIVDSINLQAEVADISNKYSNEVPSQYHGLPGVVTVPQTYDLNAIRTDNARMMELKDDNDRANEQKDMYLRVAREDLRLFLTAWRRVNVTNLSFDQFVDSLNKVGV
jgi:Ni,Fe-hydrogenase I large subunit